MVDDDTKRRLTDAYEKALATVKKCTPGKLGFTSEAKYGQAYQQLVNAGLAPQLKGKYRGR
jgi:hypothetical protein